jgi:hypothetical protein
MHDSRQDRHIAQFYEWELRGRGWLLCDHPVELEAPFHPFFFHRAPMPYIDDGKRDTILSNLAGLFRTQHSVPDIEVPELPPIEPFAYEHDGNVRVLHISFQRGITIKPERMEQIFVMLTQYAGQQSFEIIATHTEIAIQLVCTDADYDMVCTQLHAFIPEAIVREDADRLCIMHNAIYTTDFGLSEEFMRPLATGGGEDPYIGLFAYFDLLQPDEQIVIQYLFAGTVNQWSQSIMTAVTINGKESFFEDAPEMPSLAQDKISRPLVTVSIRAFAQARTLERAEELLHHTCTFLVSLSASKANRLLMLLNHTYDIDTRLADIVDRTSHRLGMLLNVRELATLAHFPSSAVRSKKLLHTVKTTKAAPQENGTYCIGINNHLGREQDVIISDAKRLEHIHIIGATGTGKSTSLHSLICQDIINGNGIAVLDPHGDLIEHILPYIPKHRINDVLIIDPSDADYPIGFNLLHAHTQLEKELLASDLVSLFRRFSTSWGDQMNSVFANAILAFLESTTGGTLVDLRRFLIEKPFREQFLKTVTDPAIVYYWQHEYPLLKSSSLGSILTRLDTFLRPKLIRNMVSQQSSIDMEQLMDTQKIVLVKLSQGLIGEENSYLLGACIVAKIQQAAMARQAKAKADRSPFFLYIDEFHHFLTTYMSVILTGARKYMVGLIVAHQDMQQVSKHDSELAGSIIANAGTRICFRLGDTDAKKFADGFSSFSTEDIQNLDRGEAIMRIGRAEDDCNVRIVPIPDDVIHNLQEEIIARSRETYAIPLAKPSSLTPVDVEPIPLTTQPKEQPILQALSPTQQENTIEKLAGRAELKQHRYLQTLIKKMAEERGYKAEIELPTRDGKGKVDVSLERDGKRIACEISVTTTTEWELHNIRKCIEAGYNEIILCSPNHNTLRNIRAQLINPFTETERQIIHPMSPEMVSAFFEAQETSTATTEHRVKGYRVQVSYEAISTMEQQQKNASVSRIVRDAMNKKK